VAGVLRDLFRRCGEAVIEPGRRISDLTERLVESIPELRAG
jgi:hypothetical protein